MMAATLTTRVQGTEFIKLALTLSLLGCYATQLARRAKAKAAEYAAAEMRLFKQAAAQTAAFILPLTLLILAFVAATHANMTVMTQLGGRLLPLLFFFLLAQPVFTVLQRSSQEVF
jgi:hypothetical protein